MDFNSTKDYLALVDVLADDYNITEENVASLMGYVKSIYRSEVENKYSAPMLYIGIYIALASLVCIVAMVADLLHGLRSRKLWFPCKYFRINAAFLSVIAVAMKLPVDLSGSMPGDVDQVGKLGSMAFMCTMMANLLPCLATMDSNELLSNITALSILVITLVVNIFIQILTGVVSYKEDAQMLQVVSPNYDVKISKHRNTMLASIYVALLLVLLIVHVSTCLAILKSKKIIDSKYQQGHGRASKDIEPSSGELLAVEKLQKHVSNHWIMAGSGSPQFITACFRTTSASGVMCVLVTVLHTLTLSWTAEAILNKDCDSDYSWSMIVILIVQSIGVVIATIAPLSRCFATLSFKVSSKIISTHFKVFEAESYWTSKLNEWKRASIQLPILSHSLNVVIETLKNQILRVVFNSLTEETDNSERNKDLFQYVLSLEKEMELGDRTLEGLSISVNKLIQKGEKSKPENLIELINEKSTNGFHGVEKFDQIDRHHVPSLLLKQQCQDCWSLAVVNLTTIAISLPKVEKNEVESLLQSVREGLLYVKLVEECLNVSDDYVSIRKGAETLWKEVDVDHEWLDYKLQDPALSSEVKTARQILEWFKDTARNIVREDGKNDDSIPRSICANSMHRITKTILLTFHDNNDDKDSQKELFNSSSSMIADIIAACLTNLPQVITMKCHTIEIEKREDSVKDAAQLLGKTKQIIKSLQDHDIPNMDPSDMPFIDKWRDYLGDP
ncbi:hypothetical protein L1987_31103 [Smallanthus sonchifolius]|uniref:Uncharacterized protein n=1 Tax=Smallanthus sonchifolius TaxID=185202 RepID=A0ACB9I5C0_9ASTR|nr:hypothetical protein L1987_31103 [Smallanthus sonchifolius]